jgi:hypothetical protein
VPNANIGEAVGLVMCLPGSNAFVERIFCHVNYIKEDGGDCT